ncbi:MULTISPECIES: hypothetical protein [unclassified Raoultella]|uniref:hypothetical protein n=1 Tax=unclassified Raoultella TaxID=2627600 RepID=UPI001928950D
MLRQQYFRRAGRLCKGSQVSGKADASREKDDILATSIDSLRDSDENVISNKAVHFTDGLFLSTVGAVGRLLLY